MARSVAIVQAKHPKGRVNSSNIQVPAVSKSVRIYAKRDGWLDGPDEVCKIILDLSLDSGATWILNWVGFGARGGDKFEQDGTTPVFESYAQRGLPAIGSAFRVVRLTLDIPEELTTLVEVEFF